MGEGGTAIVKTVYEAKSEITITLTAPDGTTELIGLKVGDKLAVIETTEATWKRCPNCNGIGVIVGGPCSCPVGRDLAKLLGRRFRAPELGDEG